MALFLTIIALSVASIVLLLLTLNGVVSCGRSRVFPVLFFLKILLLLILAGGLPWFIGAGRSGGFPIGRLQLFGSRLLGLGFFGC